MTKKPYKTEQIEALQATQHAITLTSEHNPFIDAQRHAINNQTFCFLQCIINKEITIKPQDWPLVENLAGDLLQSSSLLNRYKVNKLVKQVNQLATEAKRNQSLLSSSLHDIDAIAEILKDKQQARSLSMQDFITAQQTITEARLNKNKRRFMLAQLQNAARSHYIELKNNQTFNADNPLHAQFEQSFNLQHIKLTHRSQQNAKPHVRTQPLQPAPRKPSFTSRWLAFGSKVKHQISSSLHKMQQQLSGLWYYGKKWAIIGASVMGSVFLGKALVNELHYQDKVNHSHKETLAPKASSSNQAAATKSFQEALQEQQSSTANASPTQLNKTQLSGDYYDTSLEIHLKSKAKVAALYHQIDSLADKGLIKFANGTNTKRYAHAATMYRLIRPNSKENKAFQNLLHGGKEDLSYINNLVIKAGAKGQGVKADDNSITTSNFAQASSDLQMQHLHNLHQDR